MALMRFEELKNEVEQAYEEYDFHVLFHAIHDFCTVDMSAFYLDIIKDRLYTSKQNSQKRRSAQTAMYQILKELMVMLMPVLSFTMEEVYQYMNKPADAPLSVQMLPWPEHHAEYINKELEEKWKCLPGPSGAKSPRSWKCPESQDHRPFPRMPKWFCMPKGMPWPS